MMSWWAVCSGLLLLLFWAVGACGRLRRLRADLEAALAALDAALEHQLVWVQSQLPPALRAVAVGPMTAEAARADAAWRHLQTASEQLAQALASARRQPLAPAIMAPLTVARKDLNQAWLQVRACGRTSDGAALPATRHAQHEQLLAQVLLRCTAFNHAAHAYNEAIGQFPAQVLACVLRYRRAGVLQPMALVT